MGAFRYMFNEAQHSISDKYDALEKRIQNLLDKDKNAIIPLSNSDLRVIAKFMNQQAIKSTTNYISALGSGEADTFLRFYSSNDFYALDSVWKGGHINYIGVGAFNTVYTNELSSAFLNPIETVAWNGLQSILRLSCSDLNDIPANLFWMNYGSTHGQ